MKFEKEIKEKVSERIDKRWLISETPTIQETIDITIQEYKKKVLDAIEKLIINKCTDKNFYEQFLELKKELGL